MVHLILVTLRLLLGSFQLDKFINLNKFTLLLYFPLEDLNCRRHLVKAGPVFSFLLDLWAHLKPELLLSTRRLSLLPLFVGRSHWKVSGPIFIQMDLQRSCFGSSGGRNECARFFSGRICAARARVFRQLLPPPLLLFAVIDFVKIWSKCVVTRIFHHRDRLVQNLLDLDLDVFV